ncbi:MAG: MEDS domain-containing protein [Nitrospirota bacterium]
MVEKLRKTEVDIVGDLPWGTHFCQFYQTKEDLIDILVPYFKAGLKNNEFCMCGTSQPLGEEEAKEAMRKSLPDFDQCLKSGQIEIIPHTEWYLKDGVFNSQRVLNSWFGKLDQALAKGYNGMRLAGNMFWSEKRDWIDLADYEEELNNLIGKYRMIAICTYYLDKCGAYEVIDVIRNHQFALIKREGKWAIVELKQAEGALRGSQNTLSTLISNLPGMVYRCSNDKDWTMEYVSEGCLELTGYKPLDLIRNKIVSYGQLIHPEDREYVRSKVQAALKESRPFQLEYRIVTADGEERWVWKRGRGVISEKGELQALEGFVTNITERKRAEEDLLRSLASEVLLTGERERRRIATDLHDHISQTLAISKIKLGTLRELLSSTDLTKHVDVIRELIEQTIQYTRSLTSELSPPILYELGFEAAVEWLAEQIQEKHGIIIDFEDDKQPKPMNDEIRTLLFKAVRELLINVVRHAQAHKAKVSVQRDVNNIRIIVEDDGVGFNISEINLGRISRFGLFSIRERLKYFGGHFEVKSEPGHGTRVTLVAPLGHKNKNTMKVT